MSTPFSFMNRRSVCIRSEVAILGLFSAKILQLTPLGLCHKEHHVLALSNRAVEEMKE